MRFPFLFRVIDKLSAAASTTEEVSRSFPDHHSVRWQARSLEGIAPSVLCCKVSGASAIHALPFALSHCDALGDGRHELRFRVAPSLYLWIARWQSRSGSCLPLRARISEYQRQVPTACSSSCLPHLSIAEKWKAPPVVLSRTFFTCSAFETSVTI